MHQLTLLNRAVFGVVALFAALLLAQPVKAEEPVPSPTVEEKLEARNEARQAEFQKEAEQTQAEMAQTSKQVEQERVTREQADAHVPTELAIETAHRKAARRRAGWYVATGLVGTVVAVGVGFMLSATFAQNEIASGGLPTGQAIEDKYNSMKDQGTMGAIIAGTGGIGLLLCGAGILGTFRPDRDPSVAGFQSGIFVW